MQIIIGTIAGFDSRDGQTAEGEKFTTQIVGVRTGEGMRERIERVNLARDFFWDGGNPGVGAEVALSVSVRAYSGRSGAGYSLTALDDVSNRIKLAEPAKS